MESVFDLVGSCGCFQISHILLIQHMRFSMAGVLYLMVFGNYEPPWQCVKHSFASNGTLFNTSASHDKDFASFDSRAIEAMSTKNETFLSMSFSDISTMSNNNNSHNNNNNNNNADLLYQYQGTCSQLKHCDEVVFDPTSVTLVSEFGLICDQAYIPSLIIALQMVGMLVGANVGGQIGEMFGRKTNIYISLTVASIATLVAAWSTSWQMHAVMTFFIGIGGGGVMATHLVYALEFLTAKWRGRYGAIPVWNAALVIFALVVMALKNWRHVYILFGSMSILTLVGFLWAPESLRWLYAHGKEEESKNLLLKIMKCNRRQQDMSDVLNKLRETPRDEQKERRYTYLDLFRSRNIFILSLKLAVLWISTNLCYYALSFSVKALSGDYYINLVVSCVSELPFMFLLGPCINKFGRKFALNAFVCLATICTITCIIINYTTSPEESGPVIKYLAITTKGCVSIVWSGMQIFSVELYPTVIRNLAMGFLNTVARSGGIIASTLIPRDQASIVVCFFVLSGALLCSFTIVLSLPETKDKPLIDRIEDPNQETKISSENQTEL